MSVVRGDYRAKRSNVEYKYEVTSHLEGDRLVWNAKVRADNEFAGTPGGVVLAAGTLINEDYLRELVELSIEHRVGVK